MITSRLKELLDQHDIRYHSLPHPTTFHANDTARAANVPLYEFAKAVIVDVDGRLCMAVLPASDQLHTEALRQALGAQRVELASEAEIREAFPDCELGAMPPFGELYGMEVFISPHLRQDEEIVFNAGSHDEALRMSYLDYERLVQPHPLHM